MEELKGATTIQPFVVKAKSEQFSWAELWVEEVLNKLMND